MPKVCKWYSSFSCGLSRIAFSILSGGVPYIIINKTSAINKRAVPIQSAITVVLFKLIIVFLI